MIQNYKNKDTEISIINDKNINKSKSLYSNNKILNLLIYSDNLLALQSLIYKYNLMGKINLVYIDPPFSTQNTFRIDGDRANTISSSNSGSIAYTDNLEGADFIEFLRKRLILIRKLMSDKASIYLHIDYKIGHYVKILMDEIFGTKNFRNDITRVKCNPKNFNRKAYGNIKDLILFYSKTDDYIWNDVSLPYTPEDIEKLFKKKD